MMDVEVGDVRKERPNVCDRMGFRVEEGSWPSIRKSGSAYRAGWRHRRRQAVTALDPHPLAHQLPCLSAMRVELKLHAFCLLCFLVQHLNPSPQLTSTPQTFRPDPHDFAPAVSLLPIQSLRDLTP
jgi:hypothetical protein